MDRLFQKRCSFQTPMSVALLISFAGLYACAAFHQLWLLLLALCASVLLTLWNHRVYAQRSDELSASDRVAMGLAAAAYLILSASLASFGIRSLAARGFRLGYLLSLVVAAAYLLLAGYELLRLKKVNPLTIRERFSAKALTDVLPISLVCLLLILLNVEIFDAWIRWDSFDYYYYVQDLSFEKITDLEELRLANHAAYGASLLYLLCNGLFGNPTLSLYGVNLALLVVGTVLFYQFTKALLPSRHPILHTLITCVYAFSPFTHGLVYSLSLETFLAFGILLFFWADVKKLPVLQTVAALLICFSKETGAAVLAIVMVVKLLFAFFDKQKKGQPILRRLPLSLAIPVLGYGLLWLYDLLSFNWISSNNMSIDTEFESSFNAFDLNSVYIKDRLTSLLFSNFTWLILLVIAVGFAVGALRNRTPSSREKRILLIELLTALAAILLPTLLFVTYNHIRYGSVFALTLLLLLPEALDRLLGNLHLRAALAGTLAALCLMQCYLTVDPLMRGIFPSINKGNGSIVYTKNNVLKDGDKMNSISVNAQYNREILYFDEALDELLREIHSSDESICLVFSGEYRAPSVGSFVYTEYLILGFGYPHLNDPFYISLDEQTGERYLSRNDEDAVDIVYATSAIGLALALPRYDRMVYVQLAFRDEGYEKNFLKGHHYQEIASVEHRGWMMTAFEFDY